MLNNEALGNHGMDPWKRQLARREREKDRGTHMSKKILRLESLFIFTAIKNHFAQMQW